MLTKKNFNCAYNTERLEHEESEEPWNQHQHLQREREKEKNYCLLLLMGERLQGEGVLL